MREPGHEAHARCPECGHAIAAAPASSTELNCTGCGETYRWDGGVLILDPRSSTGDYPPGASALLAEVQPVHFWFKSRDRLIVSVLRRAIGDLEGRRVVDFGCGTGSVSAALEAQGIRVCGVDMDLGALRHARSRMDGCLVCTSGLRPPFDGPYDAVLLADVIEHVDDDAALIAACAGVVHDRGVVLLTVPAGPWLWSPLDEVAGHKRRYSKASLIRAIERAGLQVGLVRGFNTLLLPALMLQRWHLRRMTAGDNARRQELMAQAFRLPPPIVNGVLDAVTRVDHVLGALPASMATSLLGVATKA